MRRVSIRCLHHVLRNGQKWERIKYSERLDVLNCARSRFLMAVRDTAVACPAPRFIVFFSLCVCDNYPGRS